MSVKPYYTDPESSPDEIPDNNNLLYSRPRGRPRKGPATQPKNNTKDDNIELPIPDREPAPVPRKQGRPRKNPVSP